jgi:hypothetical protein
MPASLFELTSSGSVVNRQARERLLVAGTDAATALTAAQCIESVITVTPTASRAYTTATGPAIIAELGDQVEVGTSFSVTIVNLAGATHPVVFTANATGVTITGVATVAALSSATFIGYVATASTVVFYRA